MSAAPEALNLSIAARQYVAAGWALVPIEPGSKGPKTPGWNRRENCITTVDQCHRAKSNIGLAHAYSGTCALDFDDLEKSRAWLQAKGIRLDDLWDAPDAVRISSGRPNRGKLLFKLPDGVKPLVTHNLQEFGIELRCAAANGHTMQDVLPPSIHPETGQPYRWEVDDVVGDWSAPPVLPAAVLFLWQNLDRRPEPREKPEQAQPVGLGAKDLRKLLAQKSPDIGYEEWLEVGFALHHEMRGADLGLELWDEWSADGLDYPGFDLLEKKWESFNREYTGKLKTVRSLMTEVGIDCIDDFEVLDEPEVAAAARAEKFAVRSAGEFADGPPQQWIIKGLLPKAQIGMIYGESTAGKSFVAMDMLASIARGEAWRGLRTKQMRTVMVIAEGAGGAKGRVRAYEQHHGVNLSEHPFGIIQDRPDLFGKSDHKRLAKQINDWGGADVIVVDTLSQSSVGANENSGEDMGLVLEHCYKLGAETGAMVLLVHHAGKDASRGARGWSGLKANMDVQIEVSRSLLNGRTITLAKSKDGADGDVMGFKLNIVEIGVDEDGDPITSCVIEHTSAPVAMVNAQDGLKAEHQIVLAVLSAADDFDAAMHFEDIRRAAAPRMEQRGKVDNRMRDAGKAIDKLETLGYLQKDANGFYRLKEKDQ